MDRCRIGAGSVQDRFAHGSGADRFSPRPGGGSRFERPPHPQRFIPAVPDRRPDAWPGADSSR